MLIGNRREGSLGKEISWLAFLSSCIKSKLGTDSTYVLLSFNKTDSTVSGLRVSADSSNSLVLLTSKYLFGTL